MKKIRAIAALVMLLLAVAPAAAQEHFTDETLEYKVMFKWGIINKNAGNVRISLANNADRYHARLTAKSAPWADKFYRVRDTLRSTIIREGLLPVVYEKMSHEGSEDKHDRVTYIRDGHRVSADCIRRKWKNGELVTDETRRLQATGTTVDMLTAFYYMRRLPYETWKPGHVLTINIFSGKRKELLTIKYLGTENIKTDFGTVPCRHISFIFTSDGRTRTSDDMEAWIGSEAPHIPYRLEGKLPVGKVKCFYTGKGN